MLGKVLDIKVLLRGGFCGRGGFRGCGGCGGVFVFVSGNWFIGFSFCGGSLVCGVVCGVCGLGICGVCGGCGG